MTLFGSDSPTIDLTKYRRLAYARRFNSGQLADLTGVPAQVRPHVSMNTGGRPLNVAAVEKWLGTHEHLSGDFTLDHECNRGDKGSPDQFRANMRTAAAVLKGTGWRLVEIFGQWQLQHKPGGDIKTWHSNDAQACGVDAYVEAQQRVLPMSVDFWLAPALAAWKYTGLPRLICEWGFSPLSDPTGGVDGARLAREVGRFAKDAGLDACAAWDNPATGAPGVPAGGYVFTGAVLASWQAVVEVG